MAEAASASGATTAGATLGRLQEAANAAGSEDASARGSTSDGRSSMGKAVALGGGLESGTSLEELSQTVWFEFMNGDMSAMPVTLTEADLEAHAASPQPGKERLVMKPGVLDEWTPMSEAAAVISSRASMQSKRESQRASTASGSSSIPEGAPLDISDGKTPPAAAIGNATNVRHGVSVKHDPKTGGLVGLPEGWSALLPDGCAPETQSDANLPPELRPTAQPKPGTKLHDEVVIGTPFNVSKWRPQFGLPPEAVDTLNVNGFAIPVILVKLYGALKDNGGLEEEGIFRLAPDAVKCDELREALDNDGEALERIGKGTDAHILANLIKIWFRRLPIRLLAGISSEQIGACDSGAKCMALLQGFPTLQKGLFLWLLEMMADVAERGSVNRMNERAIAIVVAPNLYDPPDPGDCPNPMAALTYTQGMSRFVTELLVYYVYTRKRVRQESAVSLP